MAGGKCGSKYSHKFYRLKTVRTGRFGTREQAVKVKIREKTMYSDFCMYCGKTRAELRLKSDILLSNENKKESVLT